MNLNNKDKLRITLLFIFLVSFSIVSWVIESETLLLFFLGAILILLIAVSLKIHRINQSLTSQRFHKQIKKQHWNYKQIEACFSLFSMIKINNPLPHMRSWAISPDFANIIVSLVKEKKPAVILELGSGVSTLVTAYALKATGRGKVIALEHNENFASVSNNNLEKHDLQNMATVIHAPLKEVKIQDKNFLWYDIKQLEKINSIDFLIVDGPPGNIQELARYPALPLLFKLLSKKAVILIDDYIRGDEKRIVDLWLREFDCFKEEIIDTEKGAVVLYRIKK